VKVKDRVDESFGIAKLIASNLQDKEHNSFLRKYQNRKIVGEQLQKQLLIIERYIHALELNKDMINQIQIIQNLDDGHKNQKLMYHMISFLSEFLNDDATLIKRAREEGYYDE
jgi:hypothetical protein